MTLGELLSAIREGYLETLRAALSEAVRSGAGRLIAEPVLRTAEGGIVRTGALGIPGRGDLFVDTARIRVDAARRHPFEPFEFRWEGAFPVRMAPFSWEACPVRFEGLGPGTSWSPLVRWFERWFDGDERREADDDGLYGVVHSLADPTPEGASSIDFGTAHVECFEQLLDTARELGARRLVVG
jgi:hypothetical protein